MCRASPWAELKSVKIPAIALFIKNTALQHESGIYTVTPACAGLIDGHGTLSL